MDLVSLDEIWSHHQMWPPGIKPGMDLVSLDEIWSHHQMWPPGIKPGCPACYSNALPTDLPGAPYSLIANSWLNSWWMIHIGFITITLIQDQTLSNILWKDACVTSHRDLLSTDNYTTLV